MIVVVMATMGVGGTLTTASPGHPGRGSLLQTALSCSNPSPWTSGNLSLAASDCQSTFGGQFGTWISDSGYWTPGSYNFSYSVPFVAEIGPSGDLVAIANFLGPFAATLTSVTAQHGGFDQTDLIANYSTNVTNASGIWNVNNTWAGNGPQWTNGSASLGVATLQLVWHIQNESNSTDRNGTYQLKLDINVIQWPWQNGTDQLGVQFSGLAPWGSRFEYNATNRTLSEYWNPTQGSGRNGSSPQGPANEWFFGIQYGENATALAPNGTRANASVGVESLLWPGGTPNRSAVVLLTFDRTVGGYSSISYDPWLLFANGPAPPGGRVGNPGTGGSGVPAIPPEVLGAAIATGLAIAVAAVWVFRVRRRPNEMGLLPGATPGPHRTRPSVPQQSAPRF